MIDYTVRIRCEGCPRFVGPLYSDRYSDIPQLAETLAELARTQRWTFEGASHWCASCAMERNRKKAATP